MPVTLSGHGFINSNAPPHSVVGRLSATNDADQKQDATYTLVDDANINGVFALHRGQIVSAWQGIQPTGKYDISVEVKIGGVLSTEVFTIAVTDASTVADMPAAPEATDPPANVDVPYVSGTGDVGNTLQSTMGNWTGEPTSYAYQWMSGGAPVGSDSADYVIAASDSGNDITCVVTATNAIGSTAAPPSNAVTVN